MNQKHPKQVSEESQYTLGQSLKRITITTKTWDRVNSEQQYQEEDIVAVASCLMDTHGYGIKQLKVLGGEGQLKVWLKSIKNFKVHQNAYFCIYNIQENHWVVFSFLEFGSEIVVLYKDSQGSDILPEIKKTISEEYPKHKLVFKSNTTNNGNGVACCGPMCLKNFDIILGGLKRKDEFINEYESVEFTSSSTVTDIRKEFRDIIFKYVTNNILLSVDDLERDEEFIVAVKKLILECVNHSGMNGLCQLYTNACQEGGDQATPNRDKVEEARRNVFESEHVKRLIERCSGESPDDSSKTIYKTNHEIEERFPEQTKVFKELFSWIMKFKDNEGRESFLKSLSEALSLKYEDIETFFRARREKEEETVQLEEDGGSLKIVSVEELERILPPLMQNNKDLEYIGEGNVRTMEELLKELILGPTWSANTDSSSPGEHNKSFLREAVSYVLGKWNNRWKNASLREIREWAVDRRSRMESEDPSRMEQGGISREDVGTTLAVLRRAHQLVTGGQVLRETQILAALVCLLGKKGTLCEMATGEGKTAVIAMLAASNILLYNEKVDIITTNHVLANEGFTSRRTFFELLGITVSCNATQHQRGQAGEGGSGARACYAADVVYGDMATFQFDYLRHECENQGTRGNRSFGRVIVDEVDSMLIDEASRIAKVAFPFPGMDFLRYIHIKIWVALAKAVHDVSEPTEEEKKLKEEEIKLKREETEKKIKINEHELTEEFDSFASTGGHTPEELNAKGIEMGKKRKDFAKRCVSEEINLKNEEIIHDIKRRIKSSKPTEINLIPAHLRNYAKRMEDKWIENALYAKYGCNEDEHYVLRTDAESKETVVIPVDYSNTGVTLKNTQWSNGLHQFVQLKHNLRVTVESLPSSFISNLGYIKMYKGKLWGETGTLGSDVETQLLSDAYDVSHTKIPTYKPKNFKEIPGFWVSDIVWKYEVISVALKYAQKLEEQPQRSVLIICKTIRDVLEVERTMKVVVREERQEMNIKIKTYWDESGSKIVMEEVGPGEIIIATNIAGRGTDLMTTKSLEKNGGLHVIVAFLPANQRVEDQAFGRTGRQGNAGTAQIILRHSDVIELGFEEIPWYLNFSSVKNTRDELEQNRIKEVRVNELKHIKFNDDIFLEFLKVYRNLTAKSGNEAIWFLAMDLKEMWAFWLNEKDFCRNHSRKTANEEFEDFLKKASKILGEGEIAFNPYYSIQLAEKFLTSGSNEKSEKALWHAINLDSVNSGILHSAFYKLFEVEVEKGRQLYERTKKALRDVFCVNAGKEKDETYKTKAKDALEKAKESLNKEITYMANYFMKENKSELEESGNNVNNDSPHTEENIERYFHYIFKDISSTDHSILLKQLKSRYAVLKHFYEQVESLLEQIQNSSKKEDGSTSGTALVSRVPVSALTTEPNFPQSVGTELEEIKQLGLETLYAVRDVHDVPINIVRSAQSQIAAGIAVAGSGVLFPPAVIFTSPLASILISEGICDIILSVISQGYEKFSKADYIKGKVIGYALSLITLGVGVILKNLAILDEAIKVCKRAVEFLRECPKMKFIFEKIANVIERLQRYFEKMRSVALIYHSRTAIALSTKQLLFSVCTDTLQRTSRNVLGSVITERIVNVQLKQMFTVVLPEIEGIFQKDVRDHIKEDDLKYITKSDLQTLTNKILNKIGVFETLTEVFVGLMRHSSSWDVKLTALGVDTALTGYQIYTCPRKFCSELKKELENEQKMKKKSGESFEELQIIILEAVSKKIYSLSMQILGKYCNTLVVSQMCDFVSSIDILQIQEMQMEILQTDEDIYSAYKLYIEQ